MIERNKKEKFLATAVLMSTIIGAGIFGLPYAAAQSGFLIAFIILFIVLGIMMILHLFYVDIVEATNKEYQLTGYISHYLGERAKKFIGLFAIIGFYGSLLIYAILGGDFLHIFLSQFINISQLHCSLILFLIGTIALYFGLKVVSKWDLVINFILIGVIVILFIWSIGNININNIMDTINFNKSIAFYGAIFYSLVGIAAIPEVRRVFSKDNRKQYKKVVIIGTMIPALIYLIFMLVVVGLGGNKTTPDAMYVLWERIGGSIIAWGSLFGFLMICSSFFSLGLALKQTYVYDFKVSKIRAWLYTCIIPIILLLAGLSNFIVIIEVLGAMIGAFEGTAIIMMYNKIKPRSRGIKLLGIAMIVVLLFGLIATIVSLLKH